MWAPAWGWRNAHATTSGWRRCSCTRAPTSNWGRFTPFAEVRLGYNLTDDGGVYFSPNIGYRFNWGRKTGVNVGVGLTLQGVKTNIYEVTSQPGDYWIMDYKGVRHDCRVCFSFRVGIDF